MSESRTKYAERVAELAAILARREPNVNPSACAEWAIVLVHMGTRAARLAERECNVGSVPEKRWKALEVQAQKIADPFGLFVKTSGDPRGYCLHLHGVGIKGNTWGGDEAGYGV